MASKADFKLIGLIAFIALILAAICWILRIFGGSGGILEFLSSLGLLVVVLFTGWYYAKGLDHFWRVIFIIIAIIAVLSFIGVSLPTFNIHILNN